MIYKSNWQDLIGTDSSKIIVASNGTRGANINCDSPYPCIYVSVKVVAQFGSIATNNCLINIYGVDRSASDTDSIPLWQQKIKEYANSDRIITIPNLDVIALDTIRVEIKNYNSSSIYTWISYKTAYLK
jgi:hypothetical protein